MTNAFGLRVFTVKYVYSESTINGRTPGKPPDTPASRTWLVSPVASAGLEPTPDTAVR